MNLENLKKLIAHHNQPVLFLGAGASVSSNGLIAQDITNFILQDLYHSTDSALVKSSFEQTYECEANFENVMEKVYPTENDRKKAVENYLEGLDPSVGYRYLALLLKLGYFYPVVLTTNHEMLLERCLMEDTYSDRKIKVKSLIQSDLQDAYMDLEDNTVYVFHLHGSFSSMENLQVTAKTTFVLPDIWRAFLHNICNNHGLLMVGYGYQDVDIRNALQTMNPISKGIYYVSYGAFQKKEKNELVKMLEYHHSSQNVIEKYSFDQFFEEIGKDAHLAYYRERGEEDIDALYNLLDQTRCFGKVRDNNLSEMKKSVEALYCQYRVDEILALKEFIYYENNKNGETYRLKQGIKYLENALENYSTFTKKKYICKLKYYLLNEYLNLFLLGDNIFSNKTEYLEKIVQMGDSCIKQLKKSDPELTIKFYLLIGEALKEKAMMSEVPESQRENVQKARKILETVVHSIGTKDDLKYYLGIAYRHLAVTYELESDLSKDNKEREKCVTSWKDYSLLANQSLEKFNENTVRGYAIMNIAASNIAMIALFSNEDYKLQLIDEGLDYLRDSIQLHTDMDEYRGIAWSNIHKCKLLRLKVGNHKFDMERSKIISEMEDSANIAVNNILRTDDLLGKGLAYQQLGVVLDLYDEYTEGNSDIKLDSSINILKKSVSILKNTGFFRGLTDSCIWLSEVLYKKWKKTGDIVYFVDAYNNLNLGLTSASENLNMFSKMEMIYEQLRKETKQIVDMI